MQEKLTPKTVEHVQSFLQPALSAGLLTQGQYHEILRRIQQTDDSAPVPPVRRSRRLTKRQYAQLMGVSPPTINRWMQQGLIHFERTPTRGNGWGHVRIPADQTPQIAKSAEGGRG